LKLPFDLNDILKCYLPEKGAHLVRALASQPVAKSCSRFGHIEVLAALHRKVREGSLRRPQLKATWKNIVADESADVWTWLPFDETVEHALEAALLKLVPKAFVRTGDAIHLATASLHGFSDIYSHDKHDAAASINGPATTSAPDNWRRSACRHLAVSRESHGRRLA
jgi:predicted nucleic acid-binding protein